ncbi:molybdopterin-guanine dinucleotide biosynthesis protein B [Candidatus Albibeggiatoa sp. nov. NOAA]|uniref:molybdopterin-guanine dinucleotide biosynthesis protein B n=1 Tax=Candidatus Albibeggiatoa sp. nov. NOAA TaxID=3162724 RepID=UPI0033052303|nr:molybdopterin-guanine dinucleotide biosynthesis protein B [Thiotrichaceae bacterium]
MAHYQLLGFVAYSGTGKTTLLEQLIPILKNRGLRIAVIKHSHHAFEIDHEGKDSYRLRHAGAVQTLLTSQKRWALVQETPERETEVTLQEAIAQLDTDSVDLILTEGFKSASYPKIELHRPSLNKPLLYPDDKDVIAIATDAPLNESPPIPYLNLNDLDEIVRFIEQFIKT